MVTRFRSRIHTCDDGTWRGKYALLVKQLSYEIWHIQARHFQKHFLDENFCFSIEVSLKAQRSVWQYARIWPNNDLAPNRWQAISWNNGGLVYWEIYASLSLNELMQWPGFFFFFCSGQCSGWVLQLHQTINHNDEIPNLWYDRFQLGLGYYISLLFWLPCMNHLPPAYQWVHFWNFKQV